MEDKCASTRFESSYQKSFQIPRCETTTEKKCGIKVGVIGKVPYIEDGCEWKEKVEC